MSREGPIALGRIVALTLALLGPAAVQAQAPTEESEASTDPRADGRGFQYGAHFVSPILVTDVRRPGSGERLLVGPGFGIRARLGYELPAGFAVEVYGGLAVNGVDTEGAMRLDRITIVDAGVAGRYAIDFGSDFVPFVQVGVGIRYFDIQWSASDGEDGPVTVPTHGAVGAQIELAPWFALELGLVVDYTLGLDVIADGVLVLTPFAGVTLYAFDADDPI